MSFKTSLRALRRGKVVKVVGAVLVTAVLATGVAHLSKSVAQDQEKINDKDGYAIAAVLCEDINETMAENGIEDIYTNPQFRGMVAHKDSGANPHEEVIEIFLVAQKEDRPYMVKASIDNEDKKVSKNPDNPDKLKSDIIDKVKEIDIEYDITPTTLETLKMLDALGGSQTPLNSPESENEHLGKSVIAGYSVSENEDGTFKVTVTSTFDAVRFKEGILNSKITTPNIKTLSFDVDSKENIEEKIASFLEKIVVKGESEYTVRYSRAEFSTEYQGKGNEYKLREVQKTTEAGAENSEPEVELGAE